jgi:hypothetical protein
MMMLTAIQVVLNSVNELNLCLEGIGSSSISPKAFSGFVFSYLIVGSLVKANDAG